MEKVKMHALSSRFWIGTYVKVSKYIENLDAMMNFYDIKPYYLILLQYKFGSNFKIEIYNPYVVEISYQTETQVLHPKLCSMKLTLINLVLHFILMHWIIVVGITI